MEKMGKMRTRNKEESRMGSMFSGEGILFMMKCLLFSYVLTAGLLLLLALLLYRFSLQENVVNIGIIVIYIAVTFLAGLIVGKRAGSRKFLWGLWMGVMYFAVLALVSLAVNRSIADVATNFATVFALCAGSGMLGGMVSK
ncbi:MAG: TIGR04086 family membrane protein [Lachnospiraceae bacterium]|jgi:putative membrane protein (TIGR04086 family)|nr:TIGR04086 family membrane protein [Lachnospiraceae bacterium]